MSASVQAEVSNDKVVFELDAYCIENTAKKVYQRLSEMILAERPEPELQGALQLVQAFLEQADFPAIRAADQELAGGHRTKVKISLDSLGRVRWQKE